MGLDLYCPLTLEYEGCHGVWLIDQCHSFEGNWKRASSSPLWSFLASGGTFCPLAAFLLCPSIYGRILAVSWDTCKSGPSQAFPGHMQGPMNVCSLPRSLSLAFRFLYILLKILVLLKFQMSLSLGSLHRFSQMVVVSLHLTGLSLQHPLCHPIISWLCISISK